MSSQVSGVVEYISTNLIEGSKVAKGELLAKIDSSDYEAKYQQAKADVMNAEATLTIQQAKVDVAKKDYELLGKNVSNERLALMLKEPELNQAKANVQSAKASLQLAQNNLDRCSIYAPFDGIVVSKDIEIATTIATLSKIATILNTDEYLINANIDTKYLSYLKVGASVDVSSIATNKNIANATVYKILPNIDSTTKRANILLSLKNPLNQKEPILTDSYVKLSIKSKPINITKLPIKYLRGDSVWVYEDNKLVIKNVSVVYRGEEWVYIDNIDPMDKIITTNLQRVADGMKLELSKGKKYAN